MSRTEYTTESNRELSSLVNLCILEGKNEDIHVKWESRDEKKSEKVPDNHENKIHPELMGMEEALPAEDLALSW